MLPLSGERGKPVKVGDDSACLLHQNGRRSDIPWLDVMVSVEFQAPTGRVGYAESSGAHHAHGLEAGPQIGDRGKQQFTLGAFVAHVKPEQRFRQVGFFRDSHEVSVQGRTSPRGGCERFVADRVEHYADEWDAVSPEAKADADVRQPAGEIPRSVDRVEVPTEGRILVLCP